MKLLQNVHEGLVPPPNCDEIIVSSGYEYYHYNCDGVDDRVRQLYIVVSVEFLPSRDTTCPYL